VDTVSWNDARAFITKLNQMTGRRYRLPTEAEWGYAPRSGGKKEKWSGTSDLSQLGNYAWYHENNGEKTCAVGTKRPNSLGLYDMGGNVWEWVQDFYGDVWYKESPGNNPQGPRTGTLKELRGGSWGNGEGFLRATGRFAVEPAFRFAFSGGFRFAAPSR
jgi:formylglycine-generating enzyme required for sulfatase activity